MDLEEVKRQAKKEIDEDDFKLAVAEYKRKLRQKRKLIDVIFPWKIIVIRKDKLNGN